MSAASLLNARLGSNAVGVADRISPDLRPPGNIMPCIVYSIEQDAPLASLASTNLRYLARCRLTILASTLTSCTTIQTAVTTRLHGATWTAGGSSAHACVVGESSTGLVEDSEPGGLDLDRTITLSIDLYHS